MKSLTALTNSGYFCNSAISAQTSFFFIIRRMDACFINLSVRMLPTRTDFDRVIL